MGQLREDSNYNLKKLERYPRPHNTGKTKVRLDMYEVEYVHQPCGIQQTIVVGNKHYPLTKESFRSTMAHFSDPTKEPILWYVQPPYHTVIVFRNVKYALIAVEYIKKATDIRKGKTIYTIDQRFLNMRRLIDVPAEAEAWIDEQIAGILGVKSHG